MTKAESGVATAHCYSLDAFCRHAVMDTQVPARRAVPFANDVHEHRPPGEPLGSHGIDAVKLRPRTTRRHCISV